MIDLNLYRSRIGMFNTKNNQPNKERTGNYTRGIPHFGSSHSYSLFFIIYLMVINYLLGMVSTLFDVTTSFPRQSPNIYLPMDHFPVHTVIVYGFTKIWFSALIAFLIKRIFQQGNTQTFKKYLRMNWTCCLYSSILCNRGKIFNRLIAGLFCWLCVINFLLIVIINPSLLNPGPKNNELTVAYQNVTLSQGLFHLKNLGNQTQHLI